ncbi:MAG: Ubiquinone biosynthesis O-methyltransferase [Owenweeksia sp. TMED14]|nr:MAG: Ubiquinone biosynthesis O-methyltransferase [Owenweeksia sp. TMED14]|tara:strand:+ start:1998 stop:2759 length:762 start_codon:yes stop_codon:yes gene_type:complete
MIELALKLIPRPWLIRISSIMRIVGPVIYFGSNFTDPIDNRKYRKFLPYGYGGRIRKNAMSPGTNSLERHRLLYLYLQRFTDFFTAPHHLLHIAPEQCFHYRFKKLPNLKVTSGDIESPLADMHFDLHSIPLNDNSFDIIFCNHVLEHVKDDLKCLSELHRVMKPGGWGIFQVPFVDGIKKTDEDPSIEDPAERERRFLQYDHVRLYGEDYPERLESIGFRVETIILGRSLSTEEVIRYSLPKNEPLYICHKD